MTVEADVAAHLASRVAAIPAAGQVAGPVDLVFSADPIGAPVAGQNVFTGPERSKSENQALPGAVPDGNVVFVRETGGLKDEPYKADTTVDTTPTAEDWPGQQNPGVQIMVRAPRGNYDAGKALADAVRRAIDKSPPTGYFESRVTLSTPLWNREDDANRDLFSINVELSFECLS